MRRRLFNLAAAVWLLLCVVTATLWALSYFRPWEKPLGTTALVSDHGYIGIAFESEVPSVLPIPYWLLLTPMLLALAWCLWDPASSRRRQPLHGLRCIRCGYDLRATPERCPECGTVVGDLIAAQVKSEPILKTRVTKETRTHHVP